MTLTCRTALRPALASLALLLLLVGFLPPPSESAPPISRQETFLVYLREQADLRPALHIRDWEQRGRFVLEALRKTAARSQPAVLSALHALQQAGHVSTVQPYYILNAVLFSGDREAARTVAHLPQVAAVYPAGPLLPVAPVVEQAPSPPPQAVEWNITRIRADQVWATYGITGTGIVVANIDSGVEYVHPALVRQYRGNLGGGLFEHDYNWWDPSDQYDYPAPISGPYPLGASHGTHTMGVLVGDDGAGNQIGVAPGARWIAAYGFSGIDGLLSAAQWMLAPWQVNDFDPDHPTADPAKRPHVVNNSWGAPGGSLLFAPILEAWQAAGIVGSFAAGNNGLRGCGTLISPSDNPGALNVGATDTSDGSAFFSSRGPNALQPWLGRYGIGPQITAPGYPIRTSDPGGGYTVSGGTSFASPHAAGVVALLWSAEPDLVGRVDETLELLRATALPRTSAETCGGVPGSQVPNNTFGWGRLDALAAVEMIWQAGTLAGRVSAADGSPLPEAHVLASRNGYTLTAPTDPAGRYALPLGQGAYTVTVRAYGYAPWMAAGVTVQQDLTTTLTVTLTPRLTYSLTGVVRGADGEPVPAQVGLWDTPLLVTASLESGAYSMTVAEGAYEMRVVGAGYFPQERTVTVTDNLTEEVTLQPRLTYYIRDNRSPCGPPFAWIDATDGTAHNIGFQEHFSIYEPTLPPFPFYEGAYNLYYVSSNGFLSFGEGYPEHSQDLPTLVLPFEGPANNAIYAFEEVFNPAYGGQGVIYHKVVEGRYLVVEFYQVEHWVSGFPETFEFVLDTATGAVLLQYLEVSRPELATVGVEDADGSDGALYAYAGSRPLTDGLAVAFYPVFGPPPVEQAPGGVWGTLSGTVYLSGTMAPAAGAPVTAASFLHTLTTTTDAAGRYRFAGICADLYRLQAERCGQVGEPVQARMRRPDDIVRADLAVPPCPPNPVLTKTVTPGTVSPGGFLTYTLTYANRGEQDLRDALLSDPLPTEVLYITSAPPAGYRDGLLTWTVAVSAGGVGEAVVVGRLVEEVTPGRRVTDAAYLSWEGAALSATAALTVGERPCREVEGPAIGWVPATPRPEQLVTFSATVVAGDAPITFTWAFGDGGTGPGALVSHTYALPGTYTVILTATNCAGAGRAAVREVLTVLPWRIYLPLILRSWP